MNWSESSVAFQRRLFFRYLFCLMRGGLGGSSGISWSVISRSQSPGGVLLRPGSVLCLQDRWSSFWISDSLSPVAFQYPIQEWQCSASSFLRAFFPLTEAGATLGTFLEGPGTVGSSWTSNSLFLVNLSLGRVSSSSGSRWEGTSRVLGEVSCGIW